MSDDINDVANLMKESSDVETAILELFKDDYKEGKKKHDTDLRTRLNKREVTGLSVISFLQNVSNEEVKIKKGRSNIKKSVSLAEGLEDLSTSLKRHKISLDGKSREEIVKLFQADLSNKKDMGFGGKLKGMFSPQP